MKRNRFVGLFLGVILGFGAICSADRPMKKKSDWYDLEQELVQRGVALDVASVIKAAQANPDPAVRWAAVELLGRRGDMAAKGALREIAAADQERLVQETAALSLARLGAADAVPMVEGFLESAKDPARRLYLAAQLTDFGDFKGYPYVVAAASSEDEHLRLLSAGGAARFLAAGAKGGEQLAAPGALVRQLLSDKAAPVRKETILQLSVAAGRGLPLQEFLTDLRKIAQEDRDPDVRLDADHLLVYWREFLSTGD